MSTCRPAKTRSTFTDKQAADEQKLLAAQPAAVWNHVNNSSPSNYYGATWNNVNNTGAHGFSEILYAVHVPDRRTTAPPSPASPATRRTSTLTGGIAMLIGRFLMIIPLLAMAGSLARKKAVPETAGTFATDYAPPSW